MADDDQVAINADVGSFGLLPAKRISQTSPFGFAIISAVIRLFSEQAVLKLKQVAKTIFAKPERRTRTRVNLWPPIHGRTKNLRLVQARLNLSRFRNRLLQIET
jgi:hypothetical protein